MMYKYIAHYIRWQIDMKGCHIALLFMSRNLDCMTIICNTFSNMFGKIVRPIRNNASSIY